MPAKQTEAPFFVINQNGVCTQGKFKSIDGAQLHAQRMAELNCGTAFYVVRAVQSYIVPKPDVVVINYGE